MTTTRPLQYAHRGDTLTIEPGTECRYLTPKESQGHPQGPGGPLVTRLRRPGLVWVMLAGQPRRVPQEALSDWRPIRGGYGGRAYRHGARA